ncbi:unnamed protein product [Vitrella brassicaformis CCMP3155]|uniref:Uncharacterized protein n=1 Tax=Vitrella brassicaformis (strain CCMP3155) TaxID=1169540 RepID=A0A0G4EF94_VITBC|nr:unnamed protein product [Vitrella brassicaformis CCMP3155]|eukprot:CEL94410.1 unnamed protein product [Vitrella brassicaformis CCMP3155]
MKALEDLIQKFQACLDEDLMDAVTTYKQMKTLLAEICQTQEVQEGRGWTWSPKDIERLAKLKDIVTTTIPTHVKILESVMDQHGTNSIISATAKRDNTKEELKISITLRDDNTQRKTLLEHQETTTTTAPSGSSESLNNA